MSLMISLHIGTLFRRDVEALRGANSVFQPHTHAASPRAVSLQHGVFWRVLMSISAMGSQPFPMIPGTVVPLMPQHSIGVSVVLGARSPLKILRVIIGLIAIEMVHIERLIARLAVEGNRYEPRYLPFALPIFTGQQNVLIAAPLCPWLQYAPNPCALAGSISPDSPEVRRAVQADISRNRQPGFRNHKNIVAHTGMFYEERT